jgi:hypothetical protein
MRACYVHASGAVGSSGFIVWMGALQVLAAKGGKTENEYGPSHQHKLDVVKCSEKSEPK